MWSFIYSGALLVWGVLVIAKMGSSEIGDKYSWIFLLVCIAALYVLWNLATDEGKDFLQERIKKSQEDYEKSQELKKHKDVDNE